MKYAAVVDCAEGHRLVVDSGGARWERKWLTTTLGVFDTFYEASLEAFRVFKASPWHTRNPHVEERP